MTLTDLVLVAVLLFGPLIPLYCVVILVTGFVLAIFLGLVALFMSRV